MASGTIGIGPELMFHHDNHQKLVLMQLILQLLAHSATKRLTRATIASHLGNTSA
jgi:hypothetical protein